MHWPAFAPAENRQAAAPELALFPIRFTQIYRTTRLAGRNAHVVEPGDVSLNGCDTNLDQDSPQSNRERLESTGIHRTSVSAQRA